jgi:ribosomal-protein-alanine N-acetyltransferase
MCSDLSRAIFIAFGFGTFGFQRIEAVVDEDNEPSKALLRKLGFTHEGCLRKRFFFNNRFWDEHYFGLLRTEYKGMRDE